MRRLHALLLAIAAAVAADQAPLKPSHDSARENAFDIFNAIDSAGRQWGSSIYHNGFGFIPATMPKGTIVYHGRHENDIPDEPEWLAFEPEHSEMFARSMKPGEDRVLPSQPPVPDAQIPLGVEAAGEDPYRRGYLQTYRTRRNLNLLYLDGMAAAKSDWGPLDSQDLVLREGEPRQDPLRDEPWRAQRLCDIVKPMGYDGVVRMEAGFEVIHCNFTDSLDLVSSARSIRESGKLTNQFPMYQFTRAVSQRYDGIGADRLRLDFSSMVSGLFFPINISSTTPGRPDLKRLGAAQPHELLGLKEYVLDISTKPRRFTVNWQAVVDQIVTRFADRFALMSLEHLKLTDFIEEVESAALTYYDAPSLPGDISVADQEQRDADALKRCSEHYLLPAIAWKDDWSPEDDLIHTAIKEVAHRICDTVQDNRLILYEASRGCKDCPHGDRSSKDDDDHTERLQQAAIKARSAIQTLMSDLGWSVWKRTRPCPADELMFVAMWPFGDEQDHWSPGCRPLGYMKSPEHFGYFHPVGAPSTQDD